MTIIIGYIDRKRSRAYMAGDSAGTNSADQQSIHTQETGKVFRLGDLLIGCTSSFRMAQLLRYRLTLPEHETGKDIYSYMADFVEVVRSCLKEGGYATKDEERERGGKFLVIYRGYLFCIESDYHFYEVRDDYNAVGSADDLALGALFALQQLEEQHQIVVPVEQRLEIAMRAAQHHNASVREPFLVLEILYNEGKAEEVLRKGE